MTRPRTDRDWPELQEAELLEALATGDRGAGRELIKRSYRSVFGALCRHTGGNQDLAADLTQETFKRAWSSLSQFGGRCRFTTWLYRIAFNTFLNHQRGQSRLRALPEDADSTWADPSPDLASVAAEKDEAEQLRLAVNELPDPLRFVVTAFYWGEIPVREIAETEGVTTVAIRKRLKKAKQAIKHHLQTKAEALR